MKRRTTIYVEGGVLQACKDMQVNVSVVAEAALMQHIEKVRKWREPSD